jgi:hypothetical protein
MLIAQKLNKVPPILGTTVIHLAKLPDQKKEMTNFISQLFRIISGHLSNLKVNGDYQSSGEIRNGENEQLCGKYAFFPQILLQRMDWSWGPLLRFSNPELNFLIYWQVTNRALFEGGDSLANFPLRELSELGNLTYDRAALRAVRDNGPRKIRGNYEIILNPDFSENYADECIAAYWGRQNSQLQQIYVMANALLKRIPHVSDSQFAKHTASAAHLLLPETLRLNTSSILSVYSPEKVVSNVFWGFLPREDLYTLEGELLSNEVVSKILALWTNTTPGELLLLSISDETDENLCHWKKQPLSHAMVPDLEKLTHAQVETLCDLFENYASEKWQNAVQDQINLGEKRILDRNFLEICLGTQNLEIIEKLLKKLYNLSQSLFYTS